MQDIGVDQPEAAGEERALPRRQAVVEVSRCRSAARSRRPAAALDRLQRCRARADRRAAGIRPPATAAGSRRAACRHRTARSCRGRDRSRAGRRRRGSRRATAPPAVERAVELEFLRALDRAIERDPRHHLRIGEVPACRRGPPRCPHPARVQTCSRCRRNASCRSQPDCAAARPPRRAWCSASITSPKTSSWSWPWAALPMRTGARAFVARQPRHLPFGQAALAGDAVHDLHLLRTAGDRAQQPVAPSLRFVVVAGIHQREQRERGVAQPAEAVVPVADAAELLGQRRGRRRDDAAGRRVGERLERDQRAHDGVRSSGPAGRHVAVHSVQNSSVAASAASRSSGRGGGRCEGA